MEAAEAEGAEAEEANGRQRFDPACLLRRLDKSKAEVDGVSSLHAHKGTPDEDGRTVEEACDDIGQQQKEIRPSPIDVIFHVVGEGGCRPWFSKEWLILGI